MASQFRSFKEKSRKKLKNKKGKKKAAIKKRAEAERAAEEEKKAVEEKRAAEETLIPVLTEQQLEENRALKKKQIARGIEAKLARNATKRIEANKARAEQKDADHYEQMKNLFKNCMKFDDEDEDEDSRV